MDFVPVHPDYAVWSYSRESNSTNNVKDDRSGGYRQGGGLASQGRIFVEDFEHIEERFENLGSRESVRNGL